MDKRNVLLVCKHILFKQIMSKLLLNISDEVELFESTTQDVECLLQDVSDIDPDLIFLEEDSPLSAESFLMRVLVARPGRPVIVVNQEDNWMHVVRWETVKLRSADDLLDAMKTVELDP